MMVNGYSFKEKCAFAEKFSVRIRDLENIFLSRKVAAHLLAGTAVGKGWDPACVPWTQQTVHSLRNVRKIM